MKLISISGLDGSGKSTQIKMLKAYLENRDKKIFYFHAIQFGVAEKIKKIRQKYCLLCLLKKKCQADRKSSSSTESVTESGKLGIWLRKIFLRIDICRFGKLVEKLEKEGYDYLLTDRYFNDIIVNIEYLIGGEASFWRPRLQIPKPDVAIYLKADPEIIMQRERKPDQGIEYLRKKKEIFDKYAAFGPPDYGLKIIDGNKTSEEIFEEIKNLI